MSILSKALATVKSHLYDKHRSHSRIIRFSKISVLLNAAIAIGKIGMDIYSFSAFLCISGLYNVGIVLARTNC